jgi:small GTP-binding protein
MFNVETISNLLKELKADPTKVTSIIPDLIKEAMEKVSEWENTNIRIAIAGKSGRGKSSLINAIAGEKVADTGTVETTQERRSYTTSSGLVLEDLPGCSTTKFPSATYFDDMELQNCDAVVLVISDRVFEDDVDLFNMLKKHNIPCFIVRTKVDSAITDAFHDSGKDESAALKEMKQDIQNHLTLENLSNIYMVSSRYPQKYELAKLVEDITIAMAGLKQSKFKVISTAYSEKAIKDKRPIIEEIASYYAWASAANGANPIPVLNISIDIGILGKLTHSILGFYGLTDAHLKNIHGKTRVMAAVSGASKFAAQYLANNGVQQALQAFAKVAVGQGGKILVAETIKSIGSWVPVIGQAVSGVIGYQLTNYFASKLIDDAEVQAINVLKSVAEEAND